MRLKIIFPVEEKGGPGSGDFGHAGRPGKVGGSSGEGGGSGGGNSDSEDPKHILLNDAVSKARSEAYKLRRKYPVMPSGKRTVNAVKSIAKDRQYKKAGITWRDILAKFTPDENIIGDVTWDRYGNTRTVR